MIPHLPRTASKDRPKAPTPHLIAYTWRALSQLLSSCVSPNNRNEITSQKRTYMYTTHLPPAIYSPSPPSDRSNYTVSAHPALAIRVGISGEALTLEPLPALRKARIAMTRER